MEQNSQWIATCPSPEPDQSSPCTHPTSWRFILIFEVALSLRFSYQNPVCTSPHPIHASYHDHLIFLGLITRIILVKEIGHKTPRYIFFSILLLPHSWIKWTLMLPTYIMNSRSQQILMCHNYNFYVRFLRFLR